jgi:hypothetical protein
MKYYNAENVSAQNYFWSSGDRENYYNTLIESLKKYLPQSSQVNEIKEDE